jgi:hypothetical protein
VLRARLGAQRLAERDERFAELLSRELWPRPAPWLALLGGALAGIFSNYLGATPYLNLLHLPLWSLLLAQLLGYLLLALLAWRGSTAAMRPLLAAWHGLWLPRRRRSGPRAAAALTHWLVQSAPLQAARVGLLWHLALLGLNLGLIAGLYLRGLGQEYLAGWQSTWLDAAQVQALVDRLLAPAAWITGLAVPDVAPLRHAAGALPGAPAATWLHLLAATVALVAVPRALLVLVAGWRCHSRAKELPGPAVHGAHDLRLRLVDAQGRLAGGPLATDGECLCSPEGDRLLLTRCHRQAHAAGCSRCADANGQPMEARISRLARAAAPRRVRCTAELGPEPGRRAPTRLGTRLAGAAPPAARAGRAVAARQTGSLAASADGLGRAASGARTAGAGAAGRRAAGHAAHAGAAASAERAARHAATGAAAPGGHAERRAACALWRDRCAASAAGADRRAAAPRRATAAHGAQLGAGRHGQRRRGRARRRRRQQAPSSAMPSAPPSAVMAVPLSSVRTDDLAALPIKALMARNPGVDWQAVGDVLYGCANQAGEDNRNVARMAALLAGLPVQVPGATVNRLCGSGLDALGTAARAIRAGDLQLGIAGGVESMSRAPFVMPKADSAFSRSNACTTPPWAGAS